MIGYSINTTLKLHMGLAQYMKYDLLTKTTLPSPLKLCSDAVVQTTCWVIWRFRNKVCFDAEPLSKNTFGDEIKLYRMVRLLAYRNSKLGIDWYDRIIDPLSICNNLM